MKKMDNLYLCRGANYKNGYDLAHVGEVRSLGEWLRLLFPDKDAVEYFKDDPVKVILDYIYTYCGKRLEKVKK